MFTMNGILNLEKPYGITSMETLRRLKRASLQKKIGHTGTLDPIATGVIPICFGKATRLAEYIIANEKEYSVKIRLGITTDTYDALGKTIEEKNPSKISLKNLEDTLSLFRGEIFQEPPMFSAIKYHGKRLYDLARSGLEVPRKPRKVNVLSLELIEYSSPFIQLKIRCSKGFYVRSLANDIGGILGCGAIMDTLVRTKSGSFHLENSIPLIKAEEKFRNEKFRDILMPLDSAVSHLPIVNVTQNHANDLSNGKLISLNAEYSHSSSPAIDNRYRAYDPNGIFVGIVRNDKISGNFHPEKIFNLGTDLINNSRD